MKVEELILKNLYRIAEGLIVANHSASETDCGYKINLDKTVTVHVDMAAKDSDNAALIHRFQFDVVMELDTTKIE